MATKLNKTLVGVLTAAAMLLMGGVGFLLIYKLPGADPHHFVELAVEHEQKGEWQQAAQNYMRAKFYDRRGAGGQGAEWLGKAAACMFKLGDIASVRGMVKESRLLNPKLIEPQRLLTEASYELAKTFPSSASWKEVLDQAARLVELDPDSVLAQEALGIAHVRLIPENAAYKETGEESLRKALKLSPTNADAAIVLAGFLYDENRGAEADSVLETAQQQCAAAAEAEARAKLLVYQGGRLLRSMRQEEGLAVLKGAETTAPKSADPHLALADYRVFRGPEHWADAEKGYRAAIQADATSVYAYVQLASLYQQQSKYEEQRKILEEGLAANPKSEGFRALRTNYLRIVMMKQAMLSILARASQSADERKKQIDEAVAWHTRAKDEVGPDHIEVRIMHGHLLREQGKIVEATTELEKADKALGRAGGVETKMLLATLYGMQNQWGASEEALRSVVAMQPGAINAYILLARTMVAQGRFEEGLRSLEVLPPPQVRDALRKHRDAAITRIECYRQLDRPEKIAEESAVLVTGPGDRLQEARLLAVQSRFEEAAEILVALLKEDPNNSLAAETLALVYHQQKNPDAARRIVQDALGRAPKNRRLLALQIGLDPIEDPAIRRRTMLEFIEQEPDPQVRIIRKYQFYVSEEMEKEAKAALDEAEKLDPNSPAIIESQFLMAVERQDWAAAEKYCERSAELNTDGSRGRLMRGRLAAIRGDLAKAVEFFREGLNLYPSNSLGWTFLAETLVQMGQRGEAKSTLERAVRLNPVNGFANRMLGILHLQDGDRAAAKRCLEATLKSLPDDEIAKARLREIAEEDDPQTGIATREKTREADPNDFENLLALGRLYARNKQSDRADECLKAAIAASKKDMRVIFHAADAYATLLERPSEGEQLLRTLLKDTPENDRKARVATMIGKFYQDLELFDDAERFYLLGASLHPDPHVLGSLGEYYTSQSRVREALDAFDKTRDLTRDQPELLKSVHRRIIQCAVLLREKERASKEIDDYIDKYPDDDQAYLFRGLYAMQLGDFRTAEKAFLQQLERRPDSAMALWQLGNLHILRRRWADGIDALQKAKAYAPQAFSFDHRVALARALIGAGRVEDGLDELKSILSEDPDAQQVAGILTNMYLEQKPPRIKEAETLVYQYLRRFPRDARWGMFLGRVGTVARNPLQAIEGYTKAVEVSRYSTNPVLMLLEALWSAQQYDAIVDFVKNRIPPLRARRIPLAHSWLARALAKRGRTDEAKAAFAEAMNLARDDFDAFRFIALAMAEALGKEPALRHADELAEKDPQNVELQKIVMHLAYVNEKFEQALAAGDRVIKTSDRDDDVLFAMTGQAIVMTKMSRYEDARKQYESVLELDPSNAIAVNNLAFLLCEELKRPAEALPYAENAEKLQPRNPNTLDTVGWVLAQNGRLTDAEGTLLRALDLDANNIAAHYHLGVVYQRLGELSEARARFELVTKSNDHPEYPLYGPQAEQSLKDLPQGAT